MIFRDVYVTHAPTAMCGAMVRRLCAQRFYSSDFVCYVHGRGQHTQKNTLPHRMYKIEYCVV